MSLVIPDELLRTAHISEADLKLEIAILLFQQKKITLGAASQFASITQVELQRILDVRKIPIHYSVENLQQDFENLEVKALDQAQPTQLEILHRIEQRRAFSPAQHHLLDTLTLLQEDRAR
jgi:predicted HTH domain antitoxin